MPSDNDDRSRLSPIDRTRELLPFRRAERLSPQALYWIGCGSYPLGEGQKKWLLEFTARLEVFLADEHKLRPELFFDFKGLLDDDELKNDFLRLANDYHPLSGLGRMPGAETTFPAAPTEEEVTAAIESRKLMDVADYIADYLYWFADKAPIEQREHFFGYGSMTGIYLEPDPATEAPPMGFTPGMMKHSMFQKYDIERIHKRGFAMQDAFLPKSKEMFGEDLKDDAQYSGLLFVLPLLGAQHFLAVSPEERASWFELFGVYIRESPAEKGLVVASKFDLDEPLIEILKQMREEGWEYPVS